MVGVGSYLISEDGSHRLCLEDSGAYIYDMTGESPVQTGYIMSNVSGLYEIACCFTNHYFFGVSVNGFDGYATELTYMACGFGKSSMKIENSGEINCY